MATATETTEQESKLEELRRLEAESRGDWVKCICTEVDEDDLVFRFETIHGRSTTKNFEVPDTLAGSDVMAFFDDVGRHPENAALMEGDEFWMHMEDRRVAASVPSEWRQKIPKPKRPNLMDRTLGPVILFPLILLSFPLMALGANEDDSPQVRAFLTFCVGLSVWSSVILLLLYFI